MYSEHLQEDDLRNETLHMKAINGEIRRNKRNRGVGMNDSDDDDEEDEERNRKIRRGMNKDSKIDRDDINALGGQTHFIV